MKWFLNIAIAALALTFIPSVVTAQPNPEVTQDVRDGAVAEKLKTQPGTVAVYAKGLCCPSCAIGIRKKVHTLAFVNQDRFTDGVELDAKTQLVTIALKKGARLDAKALAQAIVDAGYEPVHLYTLANGKVVTKDIATN